MMRQNFLVFGLNVDFSPRIWHSCFILLMLLLLPKKLCVTYNIVLFQQVCIASQIDACAADFSAYHFCLKVEKMHF